MALTAGWGVLNIRKYTLENNTYNTIELEKIFSYLQKNNNNKYNFNIKRIIKIKIYIQNTLDRVRVVEQPSMGSIP